MMQIGILQCDNVRSTLRAEYGEYPQQIEQSFRAVEAPQMPMTFRVYRAHESKLPETPDECDAYIITGSRHSVLDNDELWIHQLQNFIVSLNKAQKKVIGVCFGHQIMAVAMGGKVERADCGWQIGVHRAKVLQHKSFMQPKTGAFNIPMFCEDQVVKISDTATVLATADKCEYAMLQYGDNFLSTQGHPEFTLGFAKAALTVCKDNFPKKRFETGMASFCECELDSELLFTWFVNFLCDGQGEILADILSSETTE